MWKRSKRSSVRYGSLLRSIGLFLLLLSLPLPAIFSEEIDLMQTLNQLETSYNNINNNFNMLKLNFDLLAESNQKQIEEFQNLKLSYNQQEILLNGLKQDSIQMNQSFSNLETSLNQQKEISDSLENQLTTLETSYNQMKNEVTGYKIFSWVLLILVGACGGFLIYSVIS